MACPESFWGVEIHVVVSKGLSVLRVLYSPCLLLVSLSDLLLCLARELVWLVRSGVSVQFACIESLS